MFFLRFFQLVFMDFFFYLGLFGLYIVREFLFLEKVHISENSDDESDHDLSEIIEDELISIDEKYPKEYDTRSPYDRSDHIIEPEIFLCHS